MSIIRYQGSVPEYWGTPVLSIGACECPECYRRSFAPRGRYERRYVITVRTGEDTVELGHVRPTSIQPVPLAKPVEKDNPTMDATPDVKPSTRTLTCLDRCDCCGAQAYVHVFLTDGGELMFCAHHYRRDKMALIPCADAVIDETVLLRGDSGAVPANV